MRTRLVQLALRWIFTDTPIERLIERKFGPPSEAVAQRIQAADADTLLDWSERILTATSVDAVVH